MIRVLSVGITVVLVATYCGYALLRPLPTLTPSITIPAASQAHNVQLAWPSYGVGAIGADGYGVLETHGDDTPLPTASVIKVLTALLVLNQKPLQPDEQGPMLTITQADVDSYNKYVATDGSVVRVSLGEQISEYQALQALLLPSANNMAETLARWTFGSLDDYNRYAAEYAIKIGLNHTTITDPSGFLPTTISSPSDMISLGLLALANPVFADIVSQPSATIPVQGPVHNYNFLLGQHGIIGIKTGNNDQNQGCYLFAAKQQIDNTPVTIVGVIGNGPDLTTTIHDAVPLLASALSGFVSTETVSTKTHLAKYALPWSGATYAGVAKQERSLLWQDSTTTIQIIADKERAPLKKGAVVGQVIVHNSKLETDQQLQLVLQRAISEPNVWWRLAHPF